MSEEVTSQTNTEDVPAVIDQPKIGEAVAAVEAKGPQPIYDDTEGKEDVAKKATEEEPTKEVEKKTAEEDAKKKTDPDGTDYQLDKPEETQLSDADMERILANAKKEGLGKEAAQKIVSEADTVLKNYSERTTQAHREIVNQWAKDTKDDKEIGGEKYAESVELARRVAHRFGTEAFLKSLNDTGFGNNPEVIRTFSRIGKMMSDDKVILDGTQSVQAGKKLEDVFYGKEETT